MRILISSLLLLVVCLAGCDPFSVSENKTLLNGSKWELYGYKDANMTTMLPLADTLEFGAVPDYRYNKVLLQYNIYDAPNGPQIRLQLNDTRFGSVMGLVQIASINNGTILGETFDRPTDNASWQLWFKKI